MRDALLDQPDDDFELPAVVRRKAPAKPQRRAPKPPPAPGAVERVVSYVVGRPRQILAALFLTGCGGAIAWNALVLQSSRHPAPLFSHREVVLTPDAAAPAPSRPLPPARPEAPPVEGPAPAHREAAAQPSAPAEPAPAPAASPPKAPRSPIADMIRNGGQPVPAPAQPARATQAAAAATSDKTVAARDPIADMIRMGGPVPVPPANVGRPDAGDAVLSGQRALARLGYSVKVDGVMGAGTRQAIERFEQERRLPVTGEFNARTMRELSSASGIAVQ